MPSLAHQPVGVILGGLPFVRPDAGTIMTTKAWRQLGQAILLKDAGLDAHALATVRRLEDDLGVHDAHRRALINGVDRELQANRRQAVVRKQEEHRRARDLAAPLNAPPVTHDVLSKMADARYHEGKAKILRDTDPRENRAAIKEHETKAKLARKAAREMQAAAADQHWSEGAIGESERLAKARQEEVEEVETEIAEWVRDEDGCLVRDHSSQVGILKVEKAMVRKIVSRDGLEHMKTLGHISDRQYAAGLSYREAFNVRQDDMRASQVRETNGGGSSADERAFKRAKLATFAKECEAQVRLRCIKHLSAAQMLQHVAGRGGAIRDFGPGGRAYERNRQALAAALDVVIDIRTNTRD